MLSASFTRRIAVYGFVIRKWTYGPTCIYLRRVGCRTTLDCHEPLAVHQRGIPMPTRHATILTAALFVGACTSPGIDIESETAAIVERGEALVAAESAGDADATLAFWAPEAVMQTHGMPLVQGEEDIRAAYLGFFEALVELESYDRHIEVAASGDMAWEHGVNRAVIAGAEGNMLDMGKYMCVWKKIDGEWYIAALAFSSDSVAPAPM